MPYVAIFSGVNYRSNDLTVADLEVWHSIADATDSLRERHESGYWRHIVINYADGRQSAYLMPCVESGDILDLYYVTPADLDELKVGAHPYQHEHIVGSGPDRRLTIGPRGGIRVEKN